MTLQKILLEKQEERERVKNKKEREGESERELVVPGRAMMIVH